MDHSEHLDMEHMSDKGDPKEYAKFYALNLAIVGVAVIAARILVTDASLMDIMRVWMGLAWIVYASFQLVGYKAFVHAFMGYDLLAAWFKPYAYVYPFIEFVWGAMYLFDIAPTLRDISVVVLMAIGIVGIVRSLRSKKHMVNCACLGEVIKLPLSRVTITEDAVMLVMASIMLIAA